MASQEFTPKIKCSLDHAVDSELDFIKRIGASSDLVFAFSNLGAYEALLIILKNREQGVPVHEAVARTSKTFSGPAGILNRLSACRRLGLLEETSGKKKSQVCLVPSRKLLLEIEPIICNRLNNY